MSSHCLLCSGRVVAALEGPPATSGRTAFPPNGNAKKLINLQSQTTSSDLDFFSPNAAAKRLIQHINSDGNAASTARCTASQRARVTKCLFVTTNILEHPPARQPEAAKARGRVRGPCHEAPFPGRVRQCPDPTGLDRRKTACCQAAGQEDCQTRSVWSSCADAEAARGWAGVGGCAAVNTGQRMPVNRSRRRT